MAARISGKLKFMKVDIGICSGLVLLALVLGFITGSLTCQIVISNEAINAGVAEYRINKKTGASKFVFLINQASTKE